MEKELWGTFAVNDHCLADAFVREVLLFDRLVLPVPKGHDERERWRRPNPNAPNETWDPDRLDRILGILGSQHIEGWNGARCAWEAPWDEARWEVGKSRREVAEIVQLDTFYTTRQLLAMGDELPATVEAVAAFPSEHAAHDELRPMRAAPPDPTAAQALIMLARPLLIPDQEKDPLERLRHAVELAADPDFQKSRTAYHEWMREFVEPLQKDGATLDAIRVDRATLTFAKEKLDDLVAEERAVVLRGSRRKRWRLSEYATTVVKVSATVGLAVAAAHPAIGAIAALAEFGGWLAGKRGAPEGTPKTPLSGASMFVTAEKRLGWDVEADA